MKKHIFTFCLVFIMFSPVFAGTYSGGFGTVAQPYRIGNVADLLEIGATSADFDSYFILINDVNMAGITTFVPIGYYATTSLTSAVPFTGFFDGQGFSISNLSLTSNKPGLGLFGIVDSSDAVIKNITVIKPVFITTSSDGRIGGLVGFFDGDVIENCHIINPTISSGGASAGGLVGTTWSNYSPQISYCSVQGGSILGKNRVGGFAGVIASNDISVFRCWASAQIASNGTAASSTSELGGFTGWANFDGTAISQCFALGNVTGATISDKVGGFIGNNNANVYDCFARGNVSGRSQIGGFSGYHGHNGSPTRVRNCYSTGKPTGTGSYIGGFTGKLFTYTADCNDCYWDTITSETTTSAEGFPRTTTQMYSQSNYINWNFASIWIMPPSDYPKLRYMFNVADFDASNWVNFVDFAIFANAWQAHNGDANYNLACDLKLPANGIVDINDLSVFISNWLTD